MGIMRLVRANYLARKVDLEGLDAHIFGSGAHYVDIGFLSGSRSRYMISWYVVMPIDLIYKAREACFEVGRR